MGKIIGILITFLSIGANATETVSPTHSCIMYVRSLLQNADALGEARLVGSFDSFISLRGQGEQASLDLVNSSLSDKAMPPLAQVNGPVAQDDANIYIVQALQNDSKLLLRTAEVDRRSLDVLVRAEQKVQISEDELKTIHRIEIDCNLLPTAEVSFD